MLPRTPAGWILLVVIVLVLVYGPAGAGATAHSWLSSFGAFLHGFSGR